MSLGKFKAKQVLRELHIDDPQILQDHLKEICCARGAFVREAHLEDSDARLVVQGDKGIITVSPSDRYTSRTRFSIAHELGHFELHREEADIMRTCDERALNDWAGRERVRNLEAEANEFASELLMPEEFFKEDVVQSTPSFAALYKLSARYGTSLMATAKRFVELTPEACAAVFFKGGFITSVYQSRMLSQQFYEITPGRLEPHSVAADAVAGKLVPKTMTAVDAATWLKTPRWLAEEPIMEEARYFKNLGVGFALLWIHSASLIRH